MGYWKNQFEKIARKAIEAYAKQNGHAPAVVGIMMVGELNSQGAIAGMDFWMTIDRKPRERVKFLHLYHGPKAKFDVTGMTVLIPKFIAKLMERLRASYNLDRAIMNLQVCYDKGEIFVFLCNGTKMVKLLQEDELFDDEQIAAETLQEVNA